LDDSSVKAHVAISCLCISGVLGSSLPSSLQFQYYQDLFSHIVPWIASNHFSIKFHGQWAVWRAGNECMNNP